ncbi:MAG: threonine-phosphate decarboxylase CobD [Pseudomonadota bacterium]
MKHDLVHGGALDVMRAAFPDAPEPWIDLSTGINPWPYPDTAISADALTHLPTRTAYETCKCAMASAIGASPALLLLAPGSELLIRLLPDVIRPKRVAILSPTYGDHAFVWKQAGVDIIETADPLSLAKSVDAVVVTHPNNPDGRIFTHEALETARQTLAARGGWLIIDEAYADLIPEQSFAPRGGADGLIILRSFGKFFGLAGVRLGALLAPIHIRNAMAERLGVWPVSGPALEIGARAYDDLAWQARARTDLAAAAARLDATLTAAGLRIVGGTSLYRFVEVDTAYGLFEQLARAGISVRRFDWSQHHLRIGLPASQDAEARLKSALTFSG